MAIDDRALDELIEQSQDLQSDSRRTTAEALDHMVEDGHERRARADYADEDRERRRALRAGGVGTAGALAAVGLGTGLLAAGATPAFAQASGADVQILQTAASIENLAVATYDAALGLPFASSLPAVVQTFVTTTRSQHAEHAQAFNAAVERLGGRPQTATDPVLQEVVNGALPGLTGPGPVVALALRLEDGAAQTYVKNVGQLKDLDARNVTASIMGVEAQHVSILLAVQALLEGGAPQLITLPPDLAALPAAAGSVGFPDAFYPTTDARPKSEGAVQ
jgi:hypothetical protein